jgi:hypothetical protein
MYKGDADWKPIAAVKNNPRMQFLSLVMVM